MIPGLTAIGVLILGVVVLLAFHWRTPKGEDSGLSVMYRTEDDGPCPGPLVWFDVADGALLECHTCGYVLSTGNFHDERHSATPVMREGLAA